MVKNIVKYLKLFPFALSIVTASLLISGCGSDSSSSTSTPTKVGYFVDSAASGVSYECGGYGGVTGSDGSFLYNEGNTCSFRIGLVALGSATVGNDGYLTPGDIAGASSSDTSSLGTLNIARLLQSLDEDTNPSNGISISSLTHAASSFQTTMDIRTASESQLNTLVSNAGKSLVSVSSAQSHLTSTLTSIGRLGTPTASSSSSSSGGSSGGGSGGGTSCTATTIPTISASSITASDTGGALSATVDCASTGYFVVLPAELTAPNAAQIIAGQNADGLTSGITSGNGAYTAATAKSTTISDNTNIKTATDMKVYIVAANALDLSKQSTVTSVSLTTTGTRSVKVLKTGQTVGYALKDDEEYRKGVARSYTRDGVNGIVTDNVTGLMWQDNAIGGAVSWATAVTTCDNLSLGGYTDWRLPSETELSTLPNYGISIPAIDATFINTASNNYWSSTAYIIGTTSAWVVGFYGGYVGTDFLVNSNYVRCVRGN